MDPHTLSNAEKGGPRAKISKTMRWLSMSRIAVTALWDVALLRWAIDLVAPFCAITLLLSHSVRDALGDWFSGATSDDEPDLIWVVGVTGVSLFSTALALTWIVSTSPWVPEGVVPSILVRTAGFAEEHGWGRRAFLPGGPSDGSPAVIPASDTNPASVQVPQGATPSLVPSASGRLSAETKETYGRASTKREEQEQGRIGMSGETAVLATAVTVGSSASVLRVGSEVQLTAAVRATAVDRQPSGSVTFRSGEAVIGSARLDEKGRAVVKLKGLAPGTLSITAAFPGGRGFSGSRSGSITLTVMP